MIAWFYESGLELDYSEGEYQKNEVPETVGFEQLVTEVKWKFARRLQEMAPLNGFVLSEYILLEMGSCDCGYLTVQCVA